MAKRFFETDLWKEAWFRKLQPKYKCFWFYVQAQCDQAGIWPVDIENATFLIGEEIDEMEVLDFFKNHIIIIDYEKWLLKDFIRFQYGEVLNSNSGPHRKVISILKTSTKEGVTLYNSRLDTLNVRVSDIPKVKDKDKDKDEN